MSKRVNNKRGRLGRSPKRNKHIMPCLWPKGDRYSPYRIVPKTPYPVVMPSMLLGSAVYTTFFKPTIGKFKW